MKILIAVFLLACASAFAQTTVTATVLDPNGNVYGNGTASAATVVASGQASSSTTPVSTDSTGTFSLSLNPATYIFTVCAPPAQLGPKGNPAPTQTCFMSGPIAVSGGSMNISSQLNAVATVIGPKLTGFVSFPGVGPGTNTNALAIGSGGSLKPQNFGGIFDTGSWFLNTDPIQSTGPTISNVSSGGSLLNSNFYAVEVTYVSPIGETTPSGATPVQATGCVGNNCSITVTAASLTVPAGFTGYTVYARNTTASQSFQRIANCINITTDCTITAIPTTTAPPTTNAVMPKPSLAKTSVCPPGVTPIQWLPDANGNMNSEAYISEFFNAGGAGLGGPVGAANAGVYTRCRPMWETDQGADPPGGKNAFHVIDHLFGSTINPANQDRVLWVNGATPIGDTSAHYGVETIQSELDWNGTTGIALNGSPDGEITSGSFQTAITYNGTNTGGSLSGYGINTIRASMFNNGTNFFGVSNVHGIYSEMTNSASATAPAGTLWEVYKAKWANVGTGTNLFGNGYSCAPPSTATRFGAGNICFLVNATNLSASPGTYDQSLESDYTSAPGLPWDFAAPVRVDAINNNRTQALPVNASLSVTGSVNTNQIAANWAASYSANCAGGASGYTYQFVAVDNNGGQSPSTTFNCNTGTNPLTPVNPATLSAGAATIGPNTLLAVFGQSVRIDVYRVAGPMATGKIGTLTCNFNTVLYGCTTFTDTGLAATGTVPSANTTGEGSAAGYFATPTNTIRVAANFTTAANTSLQTITGLSWNLDANAKNYSFSCHLAYSQATANAAVAFGIQAATVAPTNIFAKGREQITVGPPDTSVSAVLATLSTTTATNIVSGTPGATATNYIADLDGTIEEPQNNQGQVINIMVSTATSGDAVTVLRGSYCQLF